MVFVILVLAAVVVVLGIRLYPEKLHCKFIQIDLHLTKKIRTPVLVMKAFFFQQLIKSSKYVRRK